MWPVLFRIPTPLGELVLHSWGTFLGASFLVGWILANHFGQRLERLEEKSLARVYVVTAVVALLGARLLYVLTNLDELTSPLAMIDIRDGGMVAYGGFLGGAVGSVVFLRLQGKPVLGWGDAVAPSLAIGLGLTRIGCYLGGCDFGRPLSSTAPLWLQALGTFPRWNTFDVGRAGSPAYLHHVETQSLLPTSAHSLPVHPTQLYEGAVGFALAALAIGMLQRRKFRGQVVLVVAALYGVLRTLIETFRDDPERGAWLGLSTSQWIALGLLPVLAIVYWTQRTEDGHPA